MNKIADLDAEDRRRASPEYGLEMEKTRAEIAKMNRDAEAGGASPSNVKEWEYFSKLGPEERRQYLAMKRADPTDKAYATAYSRDVLEGGNVDATKNLTGPWLGIMPDSIKSFTNPGAVDVKDTVEEVVQRNLRTILGAQFTQKEGDRLIARAYNPSLDEKTNAKRLGRLKTSMEAALKAKQDAGEYFQRNGTMRGFTGKTAWSVDEFVKSMDENMDQNLPTFSDPAQARGMPPGTRFKTPDGRVMEVP
jgi:hypothetical protein